MALDLPIPLSLKPMEAGPVDDLSYGKGWLYEPKYDGFRCLAFRDGDKVKKLGGGRRRGEGGGWVWRAGLSWLVLRGIGFVFFLRGGGMKEGGGVAGGWSLFFWRGKRQDEEGKAFLGKG